MPPSRRELEQTWQRLGVDVDALEIADDGSIDATLRAPPPAGAASASTKDALELGEVIGSGGMGLVYQGRQLALDRDVAVKSVRPGQPDEVARQLIDEARVTGALEHPGVVPIYGVGSDETGRPLIVMKLVTGQSWLERIDRDERGQPADLDGALQILEQVCHAVAFAHRREVLHRDIKPANILIGDFGEVYLVDWGLAVDLGGAGIAGLPAASAVAEIAGSLPYMAPEQLAASGEALGPATDVYLLGATLYEVLTGTTIREVPRAGHLREVLVRAYTEPPRPLPDWVPAELAGICDRALEPRPADRFASAQELRDAIAAFRAHRHGRELIDRARAELDAALAWLEAGDDGASVDRRLAAARFGFDQALRSWPGSPDARDGLDRALLISAERELDARRPDSARALLDALANNRPEMATTMRDRVEQLRQRIAEGLERAEAIERAVAESDLGQGARTRRTAGLLFGVLFLALHLAANALDAAGVAAVDHLIYLVMTSTLAGIFAVPILARARQVFPNQANVRFGFTLAVMLASQVAVFCGMWAGGVALPLTLAVSLVQLAGSITIKTAMFDRRVMWTAAVALACAAAAVAAPRLAIGLVGVAYACYFIAGALLSFDGSGDPELIEDLRISRAHLGPERRSRGG